VSGTSSDSRGGARAADAAPADALAEVWELLDELPRTSASAALTATTIEMAAVGVAATAATPRAGLRAWLGPAGVVLAALMVGLVAGRATAPDPDRKLLENLPVVRHLDLLREAGSVTFLEQVAGRGGPPLRMVLRQGPEAARQETAEFTAELEVLGKLLVADAATRRTVMAGLPVEERAELERSLREFLALSAAERKTLAAVAAALVDPARAELKAAALDWHRWLASSRPEDRDDIVASGADKRLDWIDWYATRLDGRDRPGGPRGPEWPPGRWPPGGEPPRGFDGRFRRPSPPREEGLQRPPDSPRDVPPPAGPPPLRPGGPDGSAPPPETPAPPG